MFCSIYRKPDLLLATGSITAKLAFPVDLQERGRLEKDGRREPTIQHTYGTNTTVIEYSKLTTKGKTQRPSHHRKGSRGRSSLCLRSSPPSSRGHTSDDLHHDLLMTCAQLISFSLPFSTLPSPFSPPFPPFLSSFFFPSLSHTFPPPFSSSLLFSFPPLPSLLFLIFSLPPSLSFSSFLSLLPPFSIVFPPSISPPFPPSSLLSSFPSPSLPPTTQTPARIILCQRRVWGWIPLPPPPFPSFLAVGHSPFLLPPPPPPLSSSSTLSPLRLLLVLLCPAFRLSFLLLSLSPAPLHLSFSPSPSSLTFPLPSPSVPFSSFPFLLLLYFPSLPSSFVLLLFIFPLLLPSPSSFSSSTSSTSFLTLSLSPSHPSAFHYPAVLSFLEAVFSPFIQSQFSSSNSSILRFSPSLSHFLYVSFSWYSPLFLSPFSYTSLLLFPLFFLVYFFPLSPHFYSTLLSSLLPVPPLAQLSPAPLPSLISPRLHFSRSSLPSLPLFAPFSFNSPPPFSYSLLPSASLLLPIPFYPTLPLFFLFSFLSSSPPTPYSSLSLHVSLILYFLFPPTLSIAPLPLPFLPPPPSFSSLLPRSPPLLRLLPFSSAYPPPLSHLSTSAPLSSSPSLPLSSTSPPLPFLISHPPSPHLSPSFPFLILPPLSHPLHLLPFLILPPSLTLSSSFSSSLSTFLLHPPLYLLSLLLSSPLSSSIHLLPSLILLSPPPLSSSLSTSSLFSSSLPYPPPPLLILPLYLLPSPPPPLSHPLSPSFHLLPSLILPLTSSPLTSSPFSSSFLSLILPPLSTSSPLSSSLSTSPSLLIPLVSLGLIFFPSNITCASS
ncbi:hypothetical protein C7M84_022777 [Penaeus vannamei]|uniref:Uncharacterized protein n=1 Tax=Penaeus vannamei TaxID=6689 RepID=A0A423U5S2_PENVA|nr:hypothetical protein C7M84_022777 [Penaeus vannamei]